MTTVAVPAEQTQKRTKPPPVTRFYVWSRIRLGVLLTATAALYLWNLSASGLANAFYSAAAQAGASDWTAMLFGSSDAANAITVDKTPAALWVIDVSVRLFGLNPWSVLMPQALEGVAAVALLYATVRRASDDGAALLAGHGVRVDAGRRVVISVQQSRRAAGAVAGRGGILRAACL
jgi:hypothetical protein